MPVEDYRLNEFSRAYDIAANKRRLKHAILADYPRKANFYDAARGKYKRQLGNVYSDKCAYCGVPVEVVPASEFQVDHIVCKSGFGDAGVDIEGGVNALSNLAFACRRCNRLKSTFLFDSFCFERLSPDKGLGKTYFRDEQYRIVVAESYSDSDAVASFHDQMRFGSELRRLDYLLSCLLDMRDYLRNELPLGEGLSQDVAHELDAAFGQLVGKRNAQSIALDKDGR